MKPRATTKTGRLEAFSDAVFAIAITLLILEVKIPSHDQVREAGGLYDYLFNLWPAYFSYFLSAAVIGIYWVNHHWLFSFIERTDHVFNLLNVAFLVTIAFIPFTSAILGDFVMDEEYRTAAVTTYALGYLMPIVPTFLLCVYGMYRHRLVKPTLSKKFIHRFTLKLTGLFASSVLAVAFSFFYPLIALAVIVIDLLFFLLPPSTPAYDQ
jgi:uncharacterized membrane protein